MATVPPDTGTGTALHRALDFAKSRLFCDRRTTVVSLLLIAGILWLLPGLLDWLLFSAHWRPTEAESCAAVAGACWAFIAEKWSVILFGVYPRDGLWRPILGAGLVLACLAYLAWRKWPARQSIVGLALTFVVFAGLLDGRLFGLEQVETVRWHGLSVVLFLGVFSLILALPMGIALAVARQDGPPLLAGIAATYIEVIRGVPLVTVLFFGIFILPLLLPKGWTYDPLLATLAALTLFHAAYFAEDVRGGLQSVATGQYDAGIALGLPYLTRIRLVILPQALSVSIPAMTNTIIGGFKDTSLVAIVGIFDLLSTTRMAYSDPAWQRHAIEGFVFIGILYVVTCLLVSRQSQALERHVAQYLDLDGKH